MRKRKSLKKNDEESEGSEPVAEPEEFQDSGEDWTPDADSVCLHFSSYFSFHNIFVICAYIYSFRFDDITVILMKTYVSRNGTANYRLS